MNYLLGYCLKIFFVMIKKILDNLGQSVCGFFMNK